MLKLWLREPHHTDDEAIKLMVDETTDVSDVLLKVPELLRVQHLKPSEIQAEYNGVVLSNRAAVLNVFEGSKEGTFVIRPRPGVVVPVDTLRESSAAHGTHGSGVKRATSLGYSKRIPLPSPRRNAIAISPRVTSESLSRSMSLGGARSKPPVVRSSSQGPITTRSNGEAALKNRRLAPGGSSIDGSTPRRVTTPRRDVAFARSDERPLLRSRHTDPRLATSRFRQVAERVKASSKKVQSNIVCNSFKPQWGKPLCATCNHSRQSHWASQRVKGPAAVPDFSADVTSTLSDVEQVQSRNPSEKITTAAENGGEISVTQNDVSLLEQHEW